MYIYIQENSFMRNSKTAGIWEAKSEGIHETKSCSSNIYCATEIVLMTDRTH